VGGGREKEERGRGCGGRVDVGEERRGRGGFGGRSRGGVVERGRECWGDVRSVAREGGERKWGGWYSWGEGI